MVKVSPEVQRTLPIGIVTVSSPWGECSTLSAAEAMYTVSIFFVRPGVYYCCVNRGGVVQR